MKAKVLDKAVAFSQRLYARVEMRYIMNQKKKKKKLTKNSSLEKKFLLLNVKLDRHSAYLPILNFLNIIKAHNWKSPDFSHQDPC